MQQMTLFLVLIFAPAALLLHIPAVRRPLSVASRGASFAIQLSEGEEAAPAPEAAPDPAADGAADAANDPKAALKAEKKALRDQIAEIEKQLTAKRGEAARAQDEAKDAGESGYMLLAANFERFRLQAKDELGTQKGYGRIAAARSLLPFCEAFEALQAERGDDAGEAGAGAIHKYYGGIWKQTQQLLEGWKCAPFPVAVGDAFDIKKHQTVESVASEEFAEGTIMDVVAQGWEMDGEIVRLAKCVVSAGVPKAEETAAEAVEPPAAEGEAAA